MESLKLTKLARNAIREALPNTNTLYTNKYDNCRTVKSYVQLPGTQARDAVDANLREQGSTDHSVKVIESYTPYGTIGALIVRVPNE